MGNELLSTDGLFDELGEIGYIVQLGQTGLERLLHGRYEDFLNAFSLYDASFAPLAVQEGELVKTYLSSLFGQPLHAVHVFGGGQG